MFILLTIGTDTTVVEVEDMNNGRIRVQAQDRRSGTKLTNEVPSADVPMMTNLLRQCVNVVNEINKQL